MEIRARLTSKGQLTVPKSVREALRRAGASRFVAQATLAALGLRDALLGAAPSADAADGLIAAIREREALLILDNCEHVIEAAAKFADRVLGECRRLRILATSREPLGITGESLLVVPPLREEPAVRLFADRAAAVSPDFTLDGDTRPLVADIVTKDPGTPVGELRRLLRDGVPRVRLFAAAAILTRPTLPPR